MAATIARAQGFQKDGRAQQAQRTALGNGEALAQANTWRTFTVCSVNADGSGYIEVTRDGERLHFFAFGSENVNG